MDKKTVLALFLTIVVLFFFQMYFSPKEEPVKQPVQESAPKVEAQQKVSTPQATQQQPSPQVSQGQPSQPAVERQAKRDVVVDTPLFTVTFTDLGGAIKKVELKKYKETVDKPAGKEMIESIKPYAYTPRLWKPAAGNGVDDRTNFLPDRGSLTVKEKEETLSFRGTMTDGTKVKKTYTFFPDAYTIDMKIETEAASSAFKTVLDFAVINDQNLSNINFKGPFVYNGKKFEQIEKIEKTLDYATSYQYAGLDESYFAFIWMPPENARPALTVLKAETGTPVLRLSTETGVYQGKLFFGPKQADVLKSLNVNAEKIIDYGWFDIIAKPLIWILNLFNRFTHNYGIDIILLTIIIKIIFYPLSIKSFKSMKEMQKLQPQLQKLKEKHKDDRQKLNQEMMEIYKRKGINPMGGCLPMVIQIPVFFALYKALSGAIELRHAPFMFWINDLSAPENLFTFAIMGYVIPIRILPLIMGATQLIQQKMTPTSVDPMQEKMMLLMPIVFTFLFYGFSSGLVLYWLVNNVISIAQQYYFNKKAS